MKEIITPSNKTIFTEEEISKILGIISSEKGSISSRIDGLTYYTINKAPNNEKKERQFEVTLHYHAPSYFESKSHIMGYFETLNFFKLLKEIELFTGI